MTTSLILPDGAPPPGSRALGVRTAPSLRLSIGFRNPERNNAPDKLDYFRAKEGANGEFKAAAAKFHSDEGYGPKPRAIDILLPPRLEDAIRIEYLAFRGSRDDPTGGVMVARGHTNFAPLGHAGGPDTLTVWDEDGTVRQVATKGIDAIAKIPLDDVAAELKIELYTTFRVGMPKILGFGSFAEITSKSLRSTDQVWQKLRDWYSMFPNGGITFAMRPVMVVKPGFARPVVIDKKTGKPRRIKSKVYTIDIVQPESVDEMLLRLDEYKRTAGALTVAPSPAVVGELEAGQAPIGDIEEEIVDGEVVDAEPSGPDTERAHPSTVETTGPEANLDADPEAKADPGARVADVPVGVEQDEIPSTAPEEVSSEEPAVSDPPPGSSDPEAEPVLEGVEPAPPSIEATAEDRALAEEAAKMKPPFGAYQHMTLGAVLKNKNGLAYLEYALRWSSDGKFPEADARFERALWAFVKVHVPDLYEEHKENAK